MGMSKRSQPTTLVTSCWHTCCCQSCKVRVRRSTLALRVDSAARLSSRSHLPVDCTQPPAVRLHLQHGCTCSTGRCPGHRMGLLLVRLQPPHPHALSGRALFSSSWAG
jgi:hypothetical protein